MSRSACCSIVWPSPNPISRSAEPNATDAIPESLGPERVADSSSVALPIHPPAPVITIRLPLASSHWPPGRSNMLPGGRHELTGCASDAASSQSSGRSGVIRSSGFDSIDPLAVIRLLILGK